MEIGFKRIKHDAKTPAVHDDNRKISDIFAAEDVLILPNETAAVSVGFAFIFPDEIGLMFMPVANLSSKASLRYPEGVRVLQNNYYSQEEVKISLQNIYAERDTAKKVHEYKLIDGTTVSDQGSLYDRGTVKICKGDCIAHMMPVEAFYADKEAEPKKPANKK
jgi:dUTPase